MLAAAPQLAVWRGTRRGLELALELVTEGGVTRGEVTVLEEWRLRRTWATILGADLADEQDPLLEGLAVSGNSIVGDTLILGDEHHREFMAVFGDATLSPEDRAAVQAFYRRTAWRVTVLVTEALDRETLGLVKRTVAAESPAHLRVQVRQVSRSFIVGVAALIGIDTHVGVEPPLRTVRLDQSRIGTGDRLRRPAGLHPDLEGEGG